MFVMVHGIPETACLSKQVEQARSTRRWTYRSTVRWSWPGGGPDHREWILDLYRSGTSAPWADWGDAWSPTVAPGLVHCPTDGPFGDDVQSGAVARMLGARHRLLEGVGHWWPLQAPEAAAALLRDFFASVP